MTLFDLVMCRANVALVTRSCSYHVPDEAALVKPLNESQACRIQILGLS
jgi:hypothetical protein